MLYPAAVNRALRRAGGRLVELAQQQQLEIGVFESALRATESLTAAEIEARIEAIPWPGARPCEEHDLTDGWIVPFGMEWTNHQQAIGWAYRRLAGVTTVAVDGSEIKPTNEYNLRVGAVQVLTYQNDHRPRGQYAKLPHFELVLPGGKDVSLRRFECEADALVEAVEALAGREPAPVVFFDGTFVLSFTSEMNQDLAQQYITAIQGVLRASRRLRVPVLGYVDASDAKDLCVLLSHLEGGPSPRRSQVTDAQLLAPLMGWGDRTRAMLCARDRVLALYRGTEDEEPFTDQLCFVYLKTTRYGPPARLDIPRWVVQDRALLEHVVDVVRAEVIIGSGYPLALSTTDRGAVLRARDREMFYRALERYADDAGGELRQSAKAASKRRRRV